MIGTRVQKYRLDKGLSLTELAERAGVAKSYLSSIERNIQSNPSISFIEKIASVLDIPFELLLHDTVKEESELDNDWTELVREAMNSGISKAEFKEFLEFNKWRNNSKSNNN